MRRLALLTTIVAAGCATSTSVVPETAPVAPSAVVAAPSGEVPAEPPFDAKAQRRTIARIEVSALELETEHRRQCRDLSRLVAELGCAFYWDQRDRPPTPAPAAPREITKADLERLAREIDEVRADIADPAERAAFDRDVTARFRAVRARIEDEAAR